MTSNFKLIILFLSVIAISNGCEDSIKTKQEINKSEDQSHLVSSKLPFRNGYLIKGSKQGIWDDIQNGYDSLQIRIWEAPSLSSEARVYIVKCRNGIWLGKFVVLELDERYVNGEASASERNGPRPFAIKRHKSFYPKIGWQRIIDSLNGLKITEIEDYNNIPGMVIDWTDGIQVIVELAGKTGYRYYEIPDPHRFADKFWQADNMLKILNIFYDQTLE